LIVGSNPSTAFSEYDAAKATVFTRLVYAATIASTKPVGIKLDPEEHQNYRWVSSLEALKGEKIVPYLTAIVPPQ
jgi:hypothetical protein